MIKKSEAYENLKNNYIDFLIENTTDITISINLEGNILFLNKSAALLHGYSFDEMAGKNASMLFFEPALFFSMIEKVKEKGKYRFIAKKVKNSGSIFYVSCNCVLIPEGDREPVILMIERDITDIIEYQRILMRFIQEEFLMKEILELFLASKDYIEAINFLYERFSNNLKIASIEMYKNEKKIYEIGEKTKKIKDMEFFSSLEAKKIMFRIYIKETELEIDIIDNLETILFYIFSNLFNIIEKFKMIQMLQKEKQKAEESDKLKSQFLINMSHEIRTPLNIMTGYIQLLSKTDLKPEQMDYLNMVAKSSDQLFLLMNEILELSKIESGEIVLREIEIDIDVLLRQFLQVYELRAKEKNLEFQGEILNLPEKIYGDPEKIGRVFSNLLDNAIKFTDKGSVKIKVYSDDTFIYCELSDTGAGISPEKEELVFKKFVQLDGSVRRKYGGTGVGLTIAKSLLDLMGGSIYFKSNVNQGTVFYFSFPIYGRREKK